MYTGVWSMQFWMICGSIYISKEFTPKLKQHIVHKSISRGSLERPVSVPEHRDTAAPLQYFFLSPSIQSSYVFSDLHIYSLANWKYNSLYNQTWISKLLSDTQTASTVWVMAHVLYFPSFPHHYNKVKGRKTCNSHKCWHSQLQGRNTSMTVKWYLFFLLVWSNSVLCLLVSISHLSFRPKACGETLHDSCIYNKLWHIGSSMQGMCSSMHKCTHASWTFAD